MEKVIEAIQITKEYDEKGKKYKALKGVDLEIYKGEFIGIMGPSGSGKTTLLNMLSTIDKPTSGKVIIDKVNLNNIRNNNLADFRRKNIGFIFQEFNLLDNMTIADNISLPLVLSNTNTEIILSKVQVLSKLLGIENQLDKYPYELSGGQKQRVAICRALISDPKVVFADEPTGALDSKSAFEVLNCFSNINKKLGITILMVTHDAKAASYSDKVMFLKDGKINGEIDSSNNKKEFFYKILNMLAVLEGYKDELL